MLGRFAQLRCLSFKDGSVCWERDLYADEKLTTSYTGFESSPLFHDGKIIIHIGSPVGIAVDAKTGRTVWKNIGKMPTHSSLVLRKNGRKNELLVAGASALCIADPRTGRVTREFPWRVGHAHQGVDPILHDDLVILSAAYGRGSIAYQLNRKSDDPVWRIGAADNPWPRWSQPVVMDGYAYAYGACLDIKTGKLSWSNGWRMPKNGAEGGVILAGKRLLMLKANSDFVVAEASPDAYRELAIAKLKPKGQRGGRYWAGPVLSDGRLLIRNKQSLTCYDLRPAK